MKERRLRRIEIFRRDLLLERAAAEGDDAPAPVGDRKHDAIAEAVVGHRDVFAGDDQAGLDHVLDRYFRGAEMLLERVLLGRRVAKPEFQLRRRRNAAVGEIAASARAFLDCQRRLEEPRREFDDVMQRLAPLLALLRPRGVSTGTGTPACPAKRSTASGKLTPSVSMTKSKMLPFLPEEKSNHIAFWSLTKNDGVFSLLNGDSPFHSRPALRNFTRRPTTSETGSRARSSSRNCGVKRMVIRQA